MSLVRFSRRVFMGAAAVAAGKMLMPGRLTATGISAHTAAKANYQDLYADTWVAVDALGRAVPGRDVVGAPRSGKTVGMFYFLTFDRHSSGPYDNTKILEAHPEALMDTGNPAWGPKNSSHYWGEPLFGYYTSDDKWALRKHAQMLANAGVDVVIFDNSNAVTYDPAREALCATWMDIREHGGTTPQIAFLCPFGNYNDGGTRTLSALYDSIYRPGRYSDLWFRWKGKPLVMADPSFADGPTDPSQHYPDQLHPAQELGQSFTSHRPFTAAGGDFPTWNTATSGLTMSLYSMVPVKRLIARQTFANVKDNATLMLPAGKTLPAGKYYLAISGPVGQIGWWGSQVNCYNGGQAFDGGTALPGDRTLSIQYAGDVAPTSVSPDPNVADTTSLTGRSREIRDFFTFRTPIAPYNIANPPANHWAWLQIYPQAPQRDLAGNVEEITVGVAQNYNATVNRTAPMSFPGAFGRSYHAGAMDTSPNAVSHGFNVEEQWKRALKIDPPFVFVTGWNEWTAGFMDDWAGFHAPPAIFVDEFDEECSRDIEPMLGGHGDSYYYQLASEIRRYKGARALPAIAPRPVKIDGIFEDWQGVTPEYRDYVGDTAHRNSPGVGTAGPFVNNSGRNDIVAAKVSVDAENVYFYVRTLEKLSPHTDDDWMLLYINSDADYATGWLGYDFVVNRKPGESTTSIERNLGGRYEWETVGRVTFAHNGNEMEIAVPRKLAGVAALPATVDFKWADHCYAKGDWTDFTLNGDAAPDDRFNYRAKLVRVAR
jgi:hypothetical protein